MSAKRLLLQVHKWCGLLVATLLLVQAATGLVLVFRDDLAQCIDPAGMIRGTTAGAVPLGDVVAAIRRRYPGFELQRIVFPRTRRATYFAHLVDARGDVRYASVDPGDARILRDGDIWRFPTEAALLLHYQLLSGRIGLTIVLLEGVALLAMIATGIAYWWPRPGRWRRSLEVNLRLPGRAVLRQAHRALGPMAALVVGLSAATGIALALGILSAPGSVRSTTPAGRSPVADANIDPAFATARRMFPGRGVRDVRMPAPGIFKVYFWAPERNPEAVAEVRIDLASLRVLATVPAAADRKLSTILLPIHSGKTLGRTGEIVIFLGGLCLLALAASGPLMWLHARRRK